MESAKVINKILLISLAFGGATLGVGMLAAEKGSSLQKALIGVGTATSIACVTGAVVASGKKEEIAEENFSKNLVKPQPEDKGDLTTQSKVSLNQTNFEQEKLEANIKPINNSQDQQIETAFYFQETNQESETAEKHKDFDVNKTNLDKDSGSSELEEENAASSFEPNELSEVISPIEEKSEDLNSQPQEELLSDFTENIEVKNSLDNSQESDINPFVNLSEESTADQVEENSELELANKLFGSINESELQVEKDAPSEIVTNVIEEESDYELEEESDYELEEESDDKSSSIAEIDADDFVGEFIEENETHEKQSLESSSIAELESDDLIVGWGNNFGEQNVEEDSSIGANSNDLINDWVENENFQEESPLEEVASDDFMSGMESDVALDETGMKSPLAEMEADEFISNLADEESTEEMSLEESPLEEVASDDFMSGMESDVALDEMSMESPVAEMEADEFISNLADEESGEEMEADEFISNLADEESGEEMSLEEFSLEEVASDDFMSGMESDVALDEMGIESPVAEVDLNDFMADFESDNSLDELNLEESSPNEVGEMDFMADFESNHSLEELSLDEPESQMDELSSLESVENKIDILTQMSDESLGELNDLLDSVKIEDLEENAQFQESYQEDKSNS